MSADAADSAAPPREAAPASVIQGWGELIPFMADSLIGDKDENERRTLNVELPTSKYMRILFLHFDVRRSKLDVRRSS